MNSSPFDYRVKLIELAWEMASGTAADDADRLRRFRTIYRHLAATVDGTMAELGIGPFGPMMSGMPGMPTPDTFGLLDRTDRDLGGLGR